MSENYELIPFVSALHKAAPNVSWQLTPVGIVGIPPDLSEDEWLAALSALGRAEGHMRSQLSWWWADLYAFGTAGQYGDRREIFESPEWTGPSYASLRNYGTTARKFADHTSRYPQLSFSHHTHIGRLPESQRAEMADRAITEELSVSQTKAAVNEMLGLSPIEAEYEVETEPSVTERVIDSAKRVRPRAEKNRHPLEGVIEALENLNQVLATLADSGTEMTLTPIQRQRLGRLSWLTDLVDASDDLVDASD